MASPIFPSFQQIVDEFGCGLDARYQQVIAGSGASDIKEVPLAVVDFFQVGIVGDILDPLLRRDDLVIAGHYWTKRKV